MASLVRPGRVRQSGFTLIELMVVTVIIGILASVGLGYFQDFLLAADVRQALPLLQNIAAKERVHYNRTGRYLASLNEEEIQRKLGVDVSDAGDFCFMTVCADATKCGNYGASPFSGALAAGTSGAFVTDGTTTTEFQVIAVLRNTTGTTATGAGSTCNVSATNPPVKKDPTGWVKSAGVKAGAGRVVVLSYPAPPDGLGSAIAIAGHAVTLDWISGVSISDAVTP